jgi:hypothetical protein
VIAHEIAYRIANMIANTIARMIAEVIFLAKADFHRIYRIPIAKQIAI